MAIPSGSGSEVLKRVAGTVDGANASVLTVAANHICIILSINITNTSNNTTDMYIYANNGSADLDIAQKNMSYNGGLDGKETFIYNDKLVLYPADVLKIQEDGSGQFEYWVSYIEQDWS